MSFFRNGNAKAGPDRAHFDDLEDNLQKILREEGPVQRPATEFAPAAPQPMDYSLERVESFLSTRVAELQQARTALAREADHTREHLADLVRRQAIMLIVETSLADGLAKLTEQMAAEEPAPVDTVAEEPLNGITGTEVAS